MQAATIERPIPVFTLVYSTIISPYFIFPLSSVSYIILLTILSFIDAPGFINLHLTKSSQFISNDLLKLLNLTNGVLPIASVILFLIVFIFSLTIC